MSIPETFYIALCVTILMLGIVYWFWTQVQYLQRKVNLLDNVVYEMKTFITNLPGKAPESVDPEQRAEQELFQKLEESPVPTAYNPPPESVAGDLEAERIASEMEFGPLSGSQDSGSNVQMNVSETEYMEPPEDMNSGNGNDDLQPGGLANADSSDSKNIAVFSDSSLESPLSSMSIKELRRMAEANNIPGAGELKKRDLIKALRDKVGQIIGNEQPNKESPVESKSEQILSFDIIGAPGSD
jgi:hypothetical protein